MGCALVELNELDVAGFLSMLKSGTRNVYGRGLKAFQQFYESQGSVRDFLDRVERDRFLPRRERQRVAIETLNGFVVCKIRKNLALPDTLYVIASDEAAKKKVVQVALKTIFRLKKDMLNAFKKVKIATLEELKNSRFKMWLEIS